MKTTLLSLCMLFISSLIYAQAHEGTVEYQKTPEPAAVLEVPYPAEIVKDALGDYLSKKGRSKGNDIKGFTTFRNTQPVSVDSVNGDLYFKMERKSRKEKQTTEISLLLMPKDGAAANTHYMTMEQAIGFLNGLIPAIEAHNLELEILYQNEAVTKAEKKYRNLVEEGKDLQKRKVNIENNIEQNTQDQQKQATEVENEKQKLAVWVSQRKS